MRTGALRHIDDRKARGAGAHRCGALWLGMTLEQPLAVGVRQPELRHIVDVIYNDRALALAVAHAAHRLLYKQRQRLGLAQEDDALTVRHVKALADYIDVAEDLDGAVAEIRDNAITLRLGCVAVNMRGRDPTLMKSLRDRF